MQAKSAEYVVFDVETTGLLPTEGDKIIEIAAVKVKDGQVIDTFESFINPQREIPIEAQRVNNITPEMVADAPIADDVLPKMIQFIGGACLVGHNVKFDLDFLCYELSLMGRKLNDVTPAMDTLKLGKKALPHLRSFRLSNIAMTLGVKVEDTHRALADVHLTVAIFNRLLALVAKQGFCKFSEVHKEFGVAKPSFKIQEVEQGFFFDHDIHLTNNS